MRIEVIHPIELDGGLEAAWNGLRARDGLNSPFLSPDWAKLIGAVRPDARLALIEDWGALAGVLGVERRSRFAALGLGAPIADYQGLIGRPDLGVGARALCVALKTGRIDLTHVPQGQEWFTPHEAGADGSWIVDTSMGFDGYRAALKTRRNEFVRQQDKKLRKLEREKGEATFAAVSRNSAHFAQMLAWKRAQLIRTGQPAIWDTPWVAETLARTFSQEEGGECAGVLFTMTIGDDLVAANYFLRGRDVLHDWIMAHNPDYEAYSPGVLLARWAVEWAAGAGVGEVDFGPGPYQYKRQLSTGQRMLAWGSASGMSMSGLVRRAAYAARAGLERTPNARLAALPGKAMRRLDLMRGLAAPAAR